jgi:hypothetical protein
VSAGYFAPPMFASTCDTSARMGADGGIINRASSPAPILSNSVLVAYRLASTAGKLQGGDLCSDIPVAPIDTIIASNRSTQCSCP